MSRRKPGRFDRQRRGHISKGELIRQFGRALWEAIDRAAIYREGRRMSVGVGAIIDAQPRIGRNASKEREI